jgi:hypothetical protein
MHKWRQRHAWLATFGVLAALLAATACTQTAPSSAQAVATAVNGAQATIAVQATAQGLNSRISSGLAQVQPQDVAKLIGTTMGATFEIATTPSDVPNDQVKQATLRGKDNGAFGRLDQQARQAFAGAGLQVARQAFPTAQIDMNVDDASGNRLLTVTYPAGGSPSYQ